jgi:hypothetical protein
MHFFCEDLSISPRTHAVSPDAADMLVFSFAVRAHAQKFHDRFGGEIIDPATRPTWRDTPATRNHLSVEQRLRNGRCINCDD